MMPLVQTTTAGNTAWRRSSGRGSQGCAQRWPGLSMRPAGECHDAGGYEHAWMGITRHPWVSLGRQLRDSRAIVHLRFQRAGRLGRPREHDGAHLNATYIRVRATQCAAGSGQRVTEHICRNPEADAFRVYGIRHLSTPTMAVVTTPWR